MYVLVEKLKKNHTLYLEAWPQDYTTFFMLISAEHEIYPAHKYQNANNYWHLSIY